MASWLSSVTIDGVDKMLALPEPAKALRIPPKPLLVVELNEPVAKLAPLSIALARFDASPVVAARSAGIVPLKLTTPKPLPAFDNH